MPYITSVERIAEERGRVEGGATVLLKLLTKACGPLPVDLEQRVQQLSIQRLENLADAVFSFRSVQDVNVWLDSQEKSLL
ncbi:MAG: DUF4351 domain-containing protein [Rhodopirellula sp.]|nr:DUF4351 domain-containing protein [Rhodopirellula sp.]